MVGAAWIINYLKRSIAIERHFFKSQHNSQKWENLHLCQSIIIICYCDQTQWLRLLGSFCLICDTYETWQIRVWIFLSVFSLFLKWWSLRRRVAQKIGEGKSLKVMAQQTLSFSSSNTCQNPLDYMIFTRSCHWKLQYRNFWYSLIVWFALNFCLLNTF